MVIIIIALFTALLVCPVVVQAHDPQVEKPTLTVVGNGQLMLAPETAFVTLGMETAGKSLAEAQRLNQGVMQKVSERLKELQIDKERIQTSSFTVSPQYKPPSKRPADAPSAPPEIIGYVVSNNVTVEVRNLDKVGAVIEGALATGANHFQGLHWALRDEQVAKLGALKQAADKARDKAVALSEALKVKLIRVFQATEASHIVHPMPRVARSMMATDGGGGEPPIFSGEIKVEATVTLVYEIGQE
jgi:uncharacterized protein